MSRKESTQKVEKEKENGDRHEQEGFEAFKEKELRSTLNELDELRKTYFKAKGAFYKRIEAWVYFILALLVGFFILISSFLLFFIYVIVIVPVYFWFRHYRLGPYRKDYEQKFKEDLIRPTLSFFADDLQYFPRQKISDPKIRESLLFPFDHDIREGDDLVKGSYRGNELRFSEIELIKKRRVQTKNGTQETKVLLFQGLFLVTEMEEDLGCSIVIRPRGFRNTQKKLPAGGLNIGFPYDTSDNLKDPDGEGELERIHLEDPEFEELFDVYGNDQIKARKLLNMNAIGDLKAFQREQEDAVFMSFRGSKLYTALEIPGGFLDPELDPNVKKLALSASTTLELPGELFFSWSSREAPESEKQLDRFYADLKGIFSIIEDLDPKELRSSG